MCGSKREATRSKIQISWPIAVLGLLALLHLIPLWITPYIPTQDGPSHVYNAFILRQYNNPEFPRFKEFYEINTRLVPNWFSHLALAGLMYLVPPGMAERIFLSGYVLLFAAALYYFLESVEKGRGVLAVLGFFFIYNYMLHMGFYNFSYSVPLYLFLLGYWWKHHDDFQFKHVVIFTLFFSLTFFFHIITSVLAIVSILFLAVLDYRLHIKKILVTLLAMIPMGLLIWNYLRDKGTQGLGWWDFKTLCQYLLSLNVLVAYNNDQLRVSVPLAILFGVLIVYTLLREKIRLGPGQIIYHWDRKDYFFLLSCLLVLIYCASPEAMSGTSILTSRISLFPWLVVLAWLSKDYPKILRRTAAALAVILLLYNLGLTMRYYIRFSRDVAEYVSGVDVIKRNRTILPLTFDPMGRSLKIWVITHAPNYYAVRTGGINYGNYEPDWMVFPTLFRVPPGEKRPTTHTIHSEPNELDVEKYADRVDYIIAWNLKPDSALYKKIVHHYECIKAHKRLTIFERKKNANIGRESPAANTHKG
jgi:hypothetical protein